jgi:hypothetical protein
MMSPICERRTYTGRKGNGSDINEARLARFKLGNEFVQFIVLFSLLFKCLNFFILKSHMLYLLAVSINARLL